MRNGVVLPIQAVYNNKGIMISRTRLIMLGIEIKSVVPSIPSGNCESDNPLEYFLANKRLYLICRVVLDEIFQLICLFLCQLAQLNTDALHVSIV